MIEGNECVDIPPSKINIKVCEILKKKKAFILTVPVKYVKNKTGSGENRSPEVAVFEINLNEAVDNAEIIAILNDDSKFESIDSYQFLNTISAGYNEQKLQEMEEASKKDKPNEILFNDERTKIIPISMGEYMGGYVLAPSDDSMIEKALFSCIRDVEDYRKGKFYNLGEVLRFYWHKLETRKNMQISRY